MRNVFVNNPTVVKFIHLVCNSESVQLSVNLKSIAPYVDDIPSTGSLSFLYIYIYIKSIAP